jgi:hypothetical protein
LSNDNTDDFSHIPQGLGDPWKPRATEPSHHFQQANGYTNDTGRVTRATINGDEVDLQTTGVQRSDTTSVAREAGRAANVPWASARTASGSPLTPEAVTDTAILRFPNGVELTPPQARLMGWLPPLNAPSGAAAAAAAKETPTEEESENPELRHDALPQEAEQTFEAITSGVSPTTLSRAMHEVANTNELSERTLSNVASEMGVEPQHVQGQMATVRAAMETQAMDAVAARGVDPTNFMSWVYATHPEEMQKAIAHHITRRQTSGYEALVDRYSQQLDKIDPEAIMNSNLAQFCSRDPRTGQIVVRTPEGTTMTWAAAVRAGVVRLQRA